MQASTPTPTRPRGRTARTVRVIAEAAPTAAPAPEAAALNARSARYFNTESVWAGSGDIDAVRIKWREYLSEPAARVTAYMAQATARLAELEAELAALAPQLSAAQERLSTADELDSAGDERIEGMKAAAAAGKITLDELVHARTRLELAREMLPALRAAHRELATKQRDLESSRNDARSELRGLDAAQAWQGVQLALAPARAALAAWFELTHDEALVIAAPKTDD